MSEHMGDWLQEQARRTYLTKAQVKAARLWASDLAELETSLRSNPLGREVRGCGPDDIMRVAARRRVGAAETKLGGAGSVFYRVAYAVAVSGRTSGEIAGELMIRTTSAMDLVRLALSDLVLVYQLSEQRLTA